ncbi:MAG: histidine--tRNA ligase [Patescibacteria group bacterium]
MKISTDSYKGVRDFYPEDMAVENQIFDIWKDVSRKYGYEEYNASVLEPAELFKAKSGEEIITKQTYTFTDRGDREVTLRPEMTPTVARMVAGKFRELAFPVRWFSIPNFFRYEQPQKGRLREFWQLNVDIFGVESLEAEVEVIQMAYDITKKYGLTDADFEIRVNSRKILDYITKHLYGLDEEKSLQMLKLIDKKNKVSKEAFAEGLTELIGDKAEQALTLLNSQNFEEFSVNLNQSKEEHEGLREVKYVMNGLEKLGITNIIFDQSITRGADYYTGVIFEVFDKNPENRRSVFGGGRYDDLLALFGGDKVTAVGFGAGDVVARDLMETYGKIAPFKSSADIYICIFNKEQTGYAQDVAQKLRASGKKVSLDYSFRKIGDQIKTADRLKIPNVIVIGEDEVKTGKLKIKNLETGEEKDLLI